MKPKSKPKIKYGVYAVILVIAIIVAANLACAGYEAGFESATADTALNKVVGTYNLFMQKISGNPFKFYVCDNTWRNVFFGIGIWFIVVIIIENRNRNLIKGKEYGTARWGTQNDIKDLFAENICKAEIKSASQVGTKRGRRKAKRRAYADCERDGKRLRQSKMEMLEAAEYEAKIAGAYSKERHEEEIARINKEVAEAVKAAKRDAWEPNRIKADCEEEIKEIEGTVFLTEQEKAEKVKTAEAERDEKLKDFYSGAKKIERIKHKYRNADMPLTKTERISIYNYVLNNNTLILGGSGAGKTRGYVLPNVLQAHSSYIITDPKGEILEKTGYFLTEIQGYKLRVLNLDNKSLSDNYNPFYYLHPDRPGYEERVLSLIETIIINTDDGEKKTSSDPFWDKAERLFLQAIFFFVSDGFTPEFRNMNTVLALIHMLKIEEEEDNFDSDLDVFAKIFADSFGEDHIGVQQYTEFREKASGKTAKSIVITAVARLAPFRAKEVKRIFTSDNMQLERVGEEKTAIFVVVPPTDSSFNFVAGMLFTQLFQELQYCASEVHKHEGQRLPVPCRFILDEFANTCKIPNFVKILAYARSFGIGITPILQSLEQIKTMYKDEWGVIIDNCNSLLFLGSITHMDTLEYISKLLGKATYDKKTSGHSYGSKGSSSENFDVVGRELMQPDEIRKMSKDDCLLIIGGRPPFYSNKYRYETHPNYRYTSDGNHAYSFSYTPAPPAPAETVGPRKTESEDAAEVVSDEETLRVVTEHFDSMEPTKDGMSKEELEAAFVAISEKPKASEETIKSLQGKKEEASKEQGKKEEASKEEDDEFEVDDEDIIPMPEDETSIREQAQNFNLGDLPHGEDVAQVVDDETTLNNLVNHFDDVEAI